jgi:hypothetical protein
MHGQLKVPTTKLTGELKTDERAHAMPIKNILAVYFRDQRICHSLYQWLQARERPFAHSSITTGQMNKADFHLCRKITLPFSEYLCIATGVGKAK